MSNYENEPPESRLNDDEIYRVLQGRLETRNFEEYTEEENITFAHDIVFDVANNFPYLAYATSNEFKGDELPSVIKPIWMAPWSPMDMQTNTRQLILCYPKDMVIYLKKREEHEQSPLQAPPEFFEIMADQSLTFDEQIEKIRAIPNIQEKLNMGEIIPDEAIYVTLDESYGGSNGLRLLVEKEKISLTIHGRRDDTAELCNFLAIYHGKTNVLAKLAACVAVLGAKHCRKPDSPHYAHFSLSDDDKRFLGDSGVDISRH